MSIKKYMSKTHVYEETYLIHLPNICWGVPELAAAMAGSSLDTELVQSGAVCFRPASRVETCLDPGMSHSRTPFHGMKTTSNQTCSAHKVASTSNISMQHARQEITKEIKRKRSTKQQRTKNRNFQTTNKTTYNNT